MTSEEARAKWLRYANGCIIQEYYKGASRPASIPPSSSSKPQSEGSTGDRFGSYDSSVDTKWWLNQQSKDNASSFWDPSWETLEKQEYGKIQELKAVIGDTLQKKPMVGDVLSEDDDMLICEKPEKLFSEMESEWIRIKKSEPWWRTADLNDLASFVSHKSLERFDNCDLPQPWINKRDGWSVPDKGLASLGVGESQSHSGVPCGLDEPLSNTTSDDAETMRELSKAQLLEALCHSQTRAREAEKAAQQAYNEKEHLITHFLRQASQLFAYKQWLHILQLETLCLHLRNNNYQPIHTRFPDFMPWVPTKSKQHKRVRHKAAKTRSFGSFLLGLTLAGAGLLIGWTLGWLFR